MLRDVKHIEEFAISKVDKTIKKGKYQAKDLNSKKEFQSFLKKHCRLRTYSFQIKKCNDRNCCGPIRNPSGTILNWLPDPILSTNKERFAPFAEVENKETTEKDLPSANVKSALEVTEVLQVT